MFAVARKHRIISGEATTLQSVNRRSNTTMSECIPRRSNTTVPARGKATLKEYEKNEARERKRALLYLILSYLKDCNLHDSAEMLSTEAQLGNQYEVCDNIDLEIILQDYHSYYVMKFNKAAKVIRKVNEDIAPTAGDVKTKTPKKRSKLTFSSPRQTCLQSRIPKEDQPANNQFAHSDESDNFQIEITHLGTKVTESVTATANDKPQSHPRCDNRNLPALCDFSGYTSEWREMADLIIREIVPKKSDGPGWEDCVGAQTSVELLKEAAVYPLEYPDLFTGLLTPWKGILLYGPPGTGKTLLAKALVNESASAFINLTISTFVSKWRGDSEKMLKVLFDVARLYAPTTIFIDELDAIASKYEDSQHDASRRFKSELLIQLDGLLGGNDKVFVLATTNSPWNLNNAILRRFEKRILLNVPPTQGRRDIFKYYLCDYRNSFSDADFESMADLTTNFTGADIKLICKEVLMRALREKLAEVYGKKCIKAGIKLRTPTLKDVKDSVQKFKTTSNTELINKYIIWEKEHGSV